MGARILTRTIAHTKMDAASESREIAMVAYLGQITNIKCGRARKL